MKYFIDFEATQFTNEIISVGCVRENGDTFYSLVKPKRMKTLTPFITDLTGITKEMLENERSSDEVFEEFFNWLETDSTYVEFYCYGNSDIDFLKKNLKDRTFNFKAQAALSLIAMNLKDYSMTVKAHFGLINCIALKKVMNYFYPEDEHTWHNALSDAEMLYKVYLGVESEETVNGIPFPEHMGTPVFRTAEDFTYWAIERINGEEVEVYNTLDEAIDYAANLMNKQHKGAVVNKTNIGKKILHAINTKDRYFNQKWKAKLKKGDE